MLHQGYNREHCYDWSYDIQDTDSVLYCRKLFQSNFLSQQINKSFSTGNICLPFPHLTLIDVTSVEAVWEQSFVSISLDNLFLISSTSGSKTSCSVEIACLPFSVGSRLA